MLERDNSIASTGNTPTVDAPTVNTPTVDAPTVNTPTINTPTVNTPTINTPTVNTPTEKWRRGAMTSYIELRENCDRLLKKLEA
mgnify:CR=1 FL=1